MSLCENNSRSVIVIGGGLVGPLCALFLARRGFQVKVFEKREDPRIAGNTGGRSINLALSNRGRRALQKVGVETEVLEYAVAMKGRLIHTIGGRQKSIPYDPTNKQCIYSVSRHYLNVTLLNALEKYSNAKLFFNHRFTKVNYKKFSVTIVNIENDQISEERADLLIGADGAFSALRADIQNVPAFDFSQTYIDHGYVELCIPPKYGTSMVPNHLHIWPRGQFMMIALPNRDGSWTVTLFMPFKRFETLDTSQKVVSMFADIFPDALKLLGEEQLAGSFFEKKPSFLVSIKCGKFHVGGNVLLIGDAAHAMVPFYGQGMNCGFEDCGLFDSILDVCENDISRAIEMFSLKRRNDAHAICDLAMYNYLEMRDLVTKPSYLARKMLDDALFWLFPKFWIPLYNSVTFSDMRYLDCIKNRRWQNRVLLLAFSTFSVCAVATTYKLMF